MTARKQKTPAHRRRFRLSSACATFDRRHRRVLASAGHLGGDRTQLGHDLAILGAVRSRTTQA